jgi:DNA-binding CsgD family transcriptional regulator
MSERAWLRAIIYERDQFAKLLREERDWLADPWPSIPCDVIDRNYLMDTLCHFYQCADEEAETLLDRYGYDVHKEQFVSRLRQPVGLIERRRFRIRLALHQTHLHHALFVRRNIQDVAQSKKSLHKAAAAVYNGTLSVSDLAFHSTQIRMGLSQLMGSHNGNVLLATGTIDRYPLASMSGWMAANIRTFPEVEKALQRAYPTLTRRDALAMELLGEAAILADPFIRFEVPFTKLPEIAANNIRERYQLPAWEVLSADLSEHGQEVDPAQMLLTKAEAQEYLHRFSPQQRQIVSLLAEGNGYAEIAEVLNTTQQTVKEQLKRARRKARAWRAQMN